MIRYVHHSRVHPVIINVLLDDMYVGDIFSQLTPNGIKYYYETTGGHKGEEFNSIRQVKQSLEED